MSDDLDTPLRALNTDSMSEREFAERILFGTTLADKLVQPTAVHPDHGSPPPCREVSFPGRPAELKHRPQSVPAFPRRSDLEAPAARGRVLHFFANHELLALELMALALRRFVDAPPPFRQGIVRTMREEQSHLSLYLERMAQLGVAFGEQPVSDFFWEALRGMRTPMDYVTGMSLTLEQANLDYSKYYRDVFADLGDNETAAILERVYQEEIGHVRHGVVWFDRWRTGAATSSWTAYTANLQLPLSPARAKAAPFNRDGRRAAGLDDDFIDQLDFFGGSKGRPPVVHWFNPEVEVEVARALTPGARLDLKNSDNGGRHAGRVADGEYLPTFLAQDGDVVLCQRAPSTALLATWRAVGHPLPEYVEFAANRSVGASITALRQRRTLAELRPWGIGPREMATGAALTTSVTDIDSFAACLMARFAKTLLPTRRTTARATSSDLAAHLGPALMDGRVIDSIAGLMEFSREVATTLACGTLLKAPYSAAGRERIRLAAGSPLSPPSQSWVEKNLARFGTLLAEPLVEIVADASLLLPGGEPAVAAVRPTLFLSDQRGQYRGHHLLPRGYADFPEALRQHLLKSRPATASTLAAALGKVFVDCAAALPPIKASGLTHLPPCGMDFYFYRLPGQDPQSLPFVQALGEINARTTMGHVALALAERIAQGEHGLWLHISPRDLENSADVDFVALATRLKGSAPLLLDPQTQRIRSGIYFTNEPETATTTLGVVVVGTARQLLKPFFDGQLGNHLTHWCTGNDDL